MVDRVVKLAAHKMEMAAIQIHVDTGSDLPLVRADAAQIEQVLLALDHQCDRRHAAGRQSVDQQPPSPITASC